MSKIPARSVVDRWVDLDPLVEASAVLFPYLIVTIMVQLMVTHIPLRVTKAVQSRAHLGAPRVATLQRKGTTQISLVISIGMMGKRCQPEVSLASSRQSWQVVPWRLPSRSTVTLKTMGEEFTIMCQVVRLVATR